MPNAVESKRTDVLTSEERAKLPNPILKQFDDPAAEGGRHAQVNYVLPAMLGNGLTPERCYDVLRPLYDKSFGDDELRRQIAYHAGKGYEPTVFRGGLLRSVPPNAPPARHSAWQALIKETPQEKKKRQAEEALSNARAFLSSFWCNSVQVIGKSPLRVLGSPREQALTYLACVHPGQDRLVNLVHAFTRDEEGRARPVGAGETYPVQVLRNRIALRGVPQSEAGAWIRHNAVTPARVEGGRHLGAGKDGAWTDADIAVTDRVLVESDVLPLGVQLAVLAHLELPILCLLDSGGRSIQAIVRTSGADVARQILEALRPLGFDPSNANPGRLSRLPGALRKVKARQPNKGEWQRLLYANPNPSGGRIL